MFRPVIIVCSATQNIKRCMAALQNPANIELNSHVVLTREVAAFDSYIVYGQRQLVVLGFETGHRDDLLGITRDLREGVVGKQNPNPLIHTARFVKFPNVTRSYKANPRDFDIRQGKGEMFAVELVEAIRRFVDGK